jgi:hypothetical protein
VSMSHTKNQAKNIKMFNVQMLCYNSCSCSRVVMLRIKSLFSLVLLLVKIIF